jgi:hypothetical protein
MTPMWLLREAIIWCMLFLIGALLMCLVLSI